MAQTALGTMVDQERGRETGRRAYMLLKLLHYQFSQVRENSSESLVTQNVCTEERHLNIPDKLTPRLHHQAWWLSD